MTWFVHTNHLGHTHHIRREEIAAVRAEEDFGTDMKPYYTMHVYFRRGGHLTLGQRMTPEQRDKIVSEITA